MATKHRILYVEGEPRWEYQVLRRAVEDDPAIEIVSMLRTTQNKIYRQGIANPNELAEGFPNKPEDLFEYRALIWAAWRQVSLRRAASPMIKDFVDRRGGGLLFLGGRCAGRRRLQRRAFLRLLPVGFPNRKNTFQRSFVAAELTDAGKKS